MIALATDIDCVRSLATQAGFTDLHATALLPGLRGNVPMIRAVPLGRLIPSPHLDTGWSAHIALDEVTLVSPSGETWSGPDAGVVVDQARAAITRDPDRGVIRIDRHPDLPLQSDLDVRAVLTGPDLFTGALSRPAWSRAAPDAS